MLNNLLIIAPEYFTFVKDQTEAISRYFQNIQVFVRYNPFAELSAIWPFRDLDTFRLDRRVSIVDLPANVHITPTPLYYLPLDYNYKVLGKTHYRKICGYVSRNDLKGGIVHAHHTWSAGYVGARLKEEHDVPFVVTAHGYDIYSLPFKDAEWRAKIEYVLNTADHIITVSQSNLACIKKLDVSTPVTVIPNGFRSDLFYPRDTSECRRALNLPQDKKIILTVGNLEHVKGQKYLVEAIWRITRERKDVLCVIVGAGKLHASLERQIHSLGLEDYIMLACGKPHDEISLWMNACDLFVLPSLNEGNPTVMFETLGCGKPFVGTKVGGVPEVITSDDYGLLVEPADPEDLAEKILVALDCKWDREAILTYAERFTWENIAKEVMCVYDQVLRMRS
ncbi:glycosyltransferase involved in cell wall biosynthesis [Methanofollis sp. W23]|uniref:glycosyltransferase n=1 Tax=Methanofollis sp. W23 TaxID=2817849 RepID=UPI001AE8A6CE|nr:glycosyltransferase [Methanofollis sp. W23]MBP2144558.1 glycosyltransferase involved in cell wall biosynthesis [Methanofollis sp. W23]